MSGCTVNICFNPPPPPPLPMLQFTAEELNELFCSMNLRTQYASCVCTMLICHYTHSLLANMLALISSCRFICWPVYCFSVTAVASLLTCLLFLSDSCSFIVDLCDMRIWPVWYIDNIAQVNLKALGFWLIWDFSTYGCHGNGVYYIIHTTWPPRQFCSRWALVSPSQNGDGAVDRCSQPSWYWPVWEHYLWIMG